MKYIVPAALISLTLIACKKEPPIFEITEKPNSYNTYIYEAKIIEGDTIKHGFYKELRDNILRQSYTFVNDTLNGVWKKYDRDGRMILKGLYQNGVRHGLVQEFTPAGMMTEEYSYVDGKVLGTGFIYEDGVVTDSIIYKEQDAKLVFSFFPGTRKIKSISNQKYGYDDGECLRFYENGQLKDSTFYVQYGHEQGISKRFYEDGTLRSEISYDQGKRSGSYKEYREDGTLSVEKSYVEDKLNGTAKSYYPGGEVASSYSYVNGNKEGLFQEFDLDGKVLRKQKYVSDTLAGKPFDTSKLRGYWALTKVKVSALNDGKKSSNSQTFAKDKSFLYYHIDSDALFRKHGTDDKITWHRRDFELRDPSIETGIYIKNSRLWDSKDTEKESAQFTLHNAKSFTLKQYHGSYKEYGMEKAVPNVTIEKTFTFVSKNQPEWYYTVSMDKIFAYGDLLK